MFKAAHGYTQEKPFKTKEITALNKRKHPHVCLKCTRPSLKVGPRKLRFRIYFTGFYFIFFAKNDKTNCPARCNLLVLGTDFLLSVFSSLHAWLRSRWYVIYLFMVPLCSLNVCFLLCMLLGPRPRWFVIYLLMVPICLWTCFSSLHAFLALVAVMCNLLVHGTDMLMNMLFFSARLLGFGPGDV